MWVIIFYYFAKKILDFPISSYDPNTSSSFPAILPTIVASTTVTIITALLLSYGLLQMVFVVTALANTSFVLRQSPWMFVDCESLKDLYFSLFRFVSNGSINSMKKCLNLFHYKSSNIWSIIFKFSFPKKKLKKNWSFFFLCHEPMVVIVGIFVAYYFCCTQNICWFLAPDIRLLLLTREDL